MKTKSKETVPVRVYLKDYEVLRRLAFRAHKPMTEILEEIIKQHALKSTGKANS